MSKDSEKGDKSRGSSIKMPESYWTFLTDMVAKDSKLQNVSHAVRVVMDQYRELSSQKAVDERKAYSAETGLHSAVPHFLETSFYEQLISSDVFFAHVPDLLHFCTRPNHASALNFRLRSDSKTTVLVASPLQNANGLSHLALTTFSTAIELILQDDLIDGAEAGFHVFFSDQPAQTPFFYFDEGCITSQAPIYGTELRHGVRWSSSSEAHHYLGLYLQHYLDPQIRCVNELSKFVTARRGLVTK